LPEPEQHTAADPAVTNLIGTKCYVNWPYLVEAIVVGTSDVSCKYHSPRHVYNKFDPLKSFNSPINTPQNGANATNANATSANATSADGKTTPPSPPSDTSNSTSPGKVVRTGDENGKLLDPTLNPTSPLEIKRVQNTVEASGYFKKVK
jgi:hypothetical protein